MSIALLLSTGHGALYTNSSSSDKAPALTGFIEFVLHEGKKQKLRLDAAAWVKEKDGKKFYSVSFGGLPATLFPETEKKSPDSADYGGSFGFERELRITGHKKMSQNEKPFIAISVAVPKPKTVQGAIDKAPASESTGSGFDFLT